MKVFGTFLGVVFGIALLTVFLAGGYSLFKYIASMFAALEPQVEILVVIASAVALLCAVIIAEGLKVRSHRGKQSVVSIAKTKIYEQLLSLWSEQLKSPSIRDVSEANVELVKLEQLLALYGSAKVITAYSALRRLANPGSSKPGDEASVLLNRLLVEMRGDIGCAEFNHKGGDILDLLLGRN